MRTNPLYSKIQLPSKARAPSSSGTTHTSIHAIAIQAYLHHDLYLFQTPKTKYSHPAFHNELHSLLLLLLHYHPRRNPPISFRANAATTSSAAPDKTPNPHRRNGTEATEHATSISKSRLKWSTRVHHPRHPNSCPTKLMIALPLPLALLLLQMQLGGEHKNRKPKGTGLLLLLLQLQLGGGHKNRKPKRPRGNGVGISVRRGGCIRGLGC